MYHVQGIRRVPLDLAHPGRVFVITALIALGTDQLTKFLVRAEMIRQQSIQVIPHLIHLTYVENRGAAFGLFPGRQPVFVITSAMVLFVIAAFWRRARPVQWPVIIALALVSAGAIGNLIDRLFMGYVTDFLEFGFMSFPVFNVADMCIVIGVSVLMGWILFGPEQEQEAELGEQDVTPLDDAMSAESGPS